MPNKRIIGNVFFIDFIIIIILHDGKVEWQYVNRGEHSSGSAIIVYINRIDRK